MSEQSYSTTFTVGALFHSESVRVITEFEEYELEVLYPLATEQVEIDLDDGVKINYPRFCQALKKIVGLEAKVK